MPNNPKKMLARSDAHPHMRVRRESDRKSARMQGVSFEDGVVSVQ